MDGISTSKARHSRGFSAVELFTVLAVIGIVTAASVPKLFSTINVYRLRSAVDLIAGELNVAKLQSTSHSNPYQIQIQTTPLPGTNQVSVVLNYMTSSSPRTFSQAPNTSATALPSNIVFGFGSVGVAAGDPNEQGNAPVQSNTITFNSLGLPVDNTGAPSQQNAIYVINTSTQQVGAVTVSLSGRVMGWLWEGGRWVQK